jgi:type VI secretion system secreted protein Hcp
MAVDSFIWFDHTGPAGNLEVAGESTDAFFGKGGKCKPSPAFEIKDWGFEVTNKTTLGSATTGAGGGKAEFAEFTITKMVDSASPNFFRNCVSGAHYKTVMLACRKAGGESAKSGKPYLVYTFGTVFTTKVSWKHSDDGPTEDITFVYGALKIDYYPQKPDGSMETVPKTKQWSVLNNTANPDPVLPDPPS